MFLKAKLLSAFLSGAVLVGSLYSYEIKAEVLNFKGLVYENTYTYELIIPQSYGSLRVWIEKDAEFDVAISKLAFYNQDGKITRLFDSEAELDLSEGWGEFVNQLDGEKRESVVYLDKLYPDNEQEFKDFLDFLAKKAHRYIIKINKGGQSNAK